MPLADFLSTARRIEDFIRPLKDVAAFSQQIAVQSEETRKAEQRAAAAKADEARVRAAITQAQADAERADRTRVDALAKELERLNKQIEEKKAEIVKLDNDTTKKMTAISDQLARAVQLHDEGVKRMAEETKTLEAKLRTLHAEEQAIRERLTAALR